LARYRYKDAPSQERLGFIIDDGKADLAVNQTLDQIDLYGYLSWTVAALQVQMNRVDAQEHEIVRLRQMLSRRNSSTSR
jgi:predicted acetyltransferase